MKDVIHKDLIERNISNSYETQYYKFSLDGAAVSNDRKIKQVVAAIEKLDFTLMVILHLPIHYFQ